MIIVSQNRKAIVNSENMFAISVSGQYVHVFYNMHDSCEIGYYATEKRAKEVLREFVSQVGSERTILVYKMPEE